MKPTFVNRNHSRARRAWREPGAIQSPGKVVSDGGNTEATALGSDDSRSKIPRFAPAARKAKGILIDLLRSVAQKHGATPAQIALAWLLAQNPWIVSLFGTRKVKRLDENLGALKVKLATADLNAIQSVAPAIKGSAYADIPRR